MRLGPYAFATILVGSRIVLAQTGNAAVCSAARTLDISKALEQTVKRVDPEYPPIAKAAGIRGTVRVNVCVSEGGSVLSAEPADPAANPILVPAALQSAQKWLFRPSSEPFRTVLEFPFFDGKTPAEVADEAARIDRFFEQDRNCGVALRGQNADQAVALCEDVPDLADRLPKERSMERITANQHAGHAYFGQMKFDEALRYYRVELKIAVATLHSYDAELAYAYRDVAMACHALGLFTEAGDDYAQAERTLMEARDHIQIDDLKPKYTATLKQLREFYLLLLQQTGQTQAAAALQRRSASDGK